MPGGQTLVTIILTFSIVIFVVSADALHPRQHINHFNHVDGSNGTVAKGIGRAIGGIAKAASNIVDGIATALKPTSNNYTDYPPAALVQEFIMAHNEARRADNVPPLVWNDTLAQFADNWARKQTDCGMRHSVSNFGENLFWGYQDHWLPREAVMDWASEKQFYNRETKKCAENKQCGHYTQIIWKTTEQVGCARFRCFNGSLLIICEYAPRGNYNGEDPFNPHTPPSKDTTSPQSSLPPPLPLQSSSTKSNFPPSSPPPTPLKSSSAKSNSHSSTSPPSSPLPSPLKSSSAKSNSHPPSSPLPSSHSSTSPPSSPLTSPLKSSTTKSNYPPSSPPPSSHSSTSPPSSPLPLSPPQHMPQRPKGHHLKSKSNNGAATTPPPVVQYQSLQH